MKPIEKKELSVPLLRPIRGLMLRESEGESEEQSNLAVSEISQDVEEISINGRVPFETRSNKEVTQIPRKCRDEL